MELPYSGKTLSTEETEALGKALADILISDKDLPHFVAMYGDLGVGKTAFVRGFCSVLCPTSAVRSPTFALVNEYKCKEEYTDISKKVYHFDMYRITDEDDLYSTGFYDYLESRNICIAEWCETIPYALPDSYISVRISKTDDEAVRLISIDLN